MKILLLIFLILIIVMVLLFIYSAIKLNSIIEKENDKNGKDME